MPGKGGGYAVASGRKAQLPLASRAHLRQGAAAPSVQADTTQHKHHVRKHASSGDAQGCRTCFVIAVEVGCEMVRRDVAEYLSQRGAMAFHDASGKAGTKASEVGRSST